MDTKYVYQSGNQTDVNFYVYETKINPKDIRLGVKNQVPVLKTIQLMEYNLGYKIPLSQV